MEQKEKKAPDTVKQAPDTSKQAPEKKEQAPAREKPSVKLTERIEKAIDRVENLHLEEYMIYRSNKKRMFFENFLNGLARGLGYAVGFTILGALLIMLLRNAAAANLPIIGNIIAEIVKIVNSKLQV